MQRLCVITAVPVRDPQHYVSLPSVARAKPREAVRSQFLASACPRNNSCHWLSGEQSQPRAADR